MPQPIKDAVSICKTIMRNGYDAYVINAALQRKVLAHSKEAEVEICTDIDLSGLKNLFPEVRAGQDDIIAQMEHNDSTFLF